jgi:hypothetical protein
MKSNLLRIEALLLLIHLFTPFPFLSSPSPLDKNARKEEDRKRSIC